MKLIRKLRDFPDSLRGGALAIGNFDGVHRGHAALIGELKKFADQQNSAAVVFTFDPHPVRILQPDKAPPPLTWTNRKADLLAELGIDAVVAYPTDPALLELTYRDFFHQIIVDTIGARAMVEGPNFFFGHGREGTVTRLAELCQDSGIRLKIVEPLTVSEDLISSSRVRDLLRQGKVDVASSMLTQPYRIRGMVTHGSARGTSIGFPTANLDAIDTLVPHLGVYAGRAFIQGRKHWAAIHVGPNPTFGENLAKVEAHILDYENSIYGQPIEVDFIQRVRDIRQFNSPEELIEQLGMDVQQVRHIARQTALTTN
ncbi:MAG: bifunctional riboflavin kinase/FAD synthetase [Planctomycetota bacterium]|nr:bifunctional riboflavin kinase/FAD synthetase [Planctomycetota bacterium]